MTAGQSIAVRHPMSAATEYPKRHLVTAEEYKAALGYRSVATLQCEARLECAALARVWVEVHELFPREG